MKNISCVPPLFYENKFVANFIENADLFSFFFVFVFCEPMHSIEQQQCLTQ